MRPSIHHGWTSLKNSLRPGEKFLRATSYQSCARHLGWRNPTQPLTTQWKMDWHSDQERNFESHILSAVQGIWGGAIPHNPLGDGMVERMSRLLLNLRTLDPNGKTIKLRRPPVVTSFYIPNLPSFNNKMSPYEVLFGQNPPLLQLPSSPTSTPQTQVITLTQTCGDVGTNLIESAETLRKNYLGQNQVKLVVGQRVHFDDPTRGKLDPRWTETWELLVSKDLLHWN